MATTLWRRPDDLASSLRTPRLSRPRCPALRLLNLGGEACARPCRALNGPASDAQHLRSAGRGDGDLDGSTAGAPVTISRPSPYGMDRRREQLWRNRPVPKERVGYPEGRVGAGYVNQPDRLSEIRAHAVRQPERRARPDLSLGRSRVSRWSGGRRLSVASGMG